MLWLALAAYNEEDNIGELLADVELARVRDGLQVSVVLVNDGSTDRTSAVARTTPVGYAIHVIEQANAGFCRALDTALREVLARAAPQDVCVTMDADHTHPAALMGVLGQTISDGFDVVIASRFAAGGRMVGVPAHREWLSALARVIMRTLVGIPGVEDYSVSYRAYRIDVLRRVFDAYPLPLDGSGFAGIAGFLVRLSYLTDRMTEVPLVLRYDFKKSPSRMRIWRSAAGYGRIVAGRWSGRYRPKD